MLVVRAGRRGIAAAIGALGVLFFVSVLPQSHELRYFLFLPLTWAAAIGILYADLSRAARPGRRIRRHSC